MGRLPLSSAPFTVTRRDDTLIGENPKPYALLKPQPINLRFVPSNLALKMQPLHFSPPFMICPGYVGVLKGTKAPVVALSSFSVTGSEDLLG